jgi:hypothetical protein
MKIIEAALLLNLATAFHFEPIYVYTSEDPVISDKEAHRIEKERHFQEDARRAAIKANKKDPKELPDVQFYRDYDHVGYSRGAIANDNSRIKIHKTKEVKDQGYCQMNDFITVHWKGFIHEKKGDKKVEDSRAWLKKPKTFILGHFEVSKCWDIAL